MLTILKYGVLVSLAICLVSLVVLVVKTFSFGRKKLYARGKGNVTRGIVYAFGKGMMPWEKESAGKHLPSYAGGILYHLGIFPALLYLLAVVFNIPLPGTILFIIQILALAGAVAGAALLAKRIAAPGMRALSVPDDFYANLLVDLFLVLTFLQTLAPALTPYLFLSAIIMFLYIPLGKIRHCFFFFYIRILYGLFYGRRDIIPPKPHVT